MFLDIRSSGTLKEELNNHDLKARHSDHEGQFKNREPKHASLCGLYSRLITVVSGLVVLDSTEQVGYAAFKAGDGLFNIVCRVSRDRRKLGFEGVGIDLEK